MIALACLPLLACSPVAVASVSIGKSPVGLVYRVGVATVFRTGMTASLGIDGLTRVYFDHNATTPVHPLARTAMLGALDCIGNPSSIHAEGRAARLILDGARRDVAALVGGASENVVFTSGATEALNMVLTPEVTSADGPMEILLIGAGEHSAVFAGHRFGQNQVEIVPSSISPP